MPAGEIPGRCRRQYNYEQVKAVCDRGLTHILPVSHRAADVSDAILYLVSDTGHDTTGSPMVLDAGRSGIRRGVVI
jgi:hypothetical protein